MWYELAGFAFLLIAGAVIIHLLRHPPKEARDAIKRLRNKK
jgi:hypothetical protein